MELIFLLIVLLFFYFIFFSKAWRKFFKESQIFQTLCPNCMGKRMKYNGGEDDMVLSEDETTSESSYDAYEMERRLNNKTKEIVMRTYFFNPPC